MITILFHVPSPQRRKLLLSWIQAELTQVQQTQRADLFRVSEADPLTVGPACWVDPVWFVPFQETPVPLLTLDAAQPGREPFPLRTHYLSEAEMARFYAASGSAVPLTRREASLED